MAVREYLQACSDLFQSGFVQENIVRKHIEQQVLIDKFLPDSASFFFVVEPASHKYHFMGKQQEAVSGYTNEEVKSRGMEFLFTCLHPDDVIVLQEKVYPKISDTLSELSRIDNIKKTVTQFNYRFKIKSGVYYHFLEHLYVLEVDADGKPSLFLGNIIVLEKNEAIPIRLTVKITQDNGLLGVVLSETYSSVTTGLENITPREIEILQNLATGKTSGKIGEELSISKHTVDTHRRNLLRKLGCKSVVELTKVAFRNGLL